MQELLNQDWGFLSKQILWDVALWRLVVALVVIFLGFLSRRIIRSVFAGKLKQKAADTRVAWDDDLIEQIPAPLALIVQVLLWYAAAMVLVLPEEPINLRQFAFQGLEVALAIAVTWVIYRLIDVAGEALSRLTARTASRLDDQLVPLLRKTLKVFIGVMVGVMIVQNLGYSVTSLIASLGIGGLALALAAKDTVANFFGSVVVFTDQPFHVGDWVQFGEVEGTIEEVGFRTTQVRRFDKARVTVPNQTFTSTPIVNYSDRSIRRIKLSVGLSYETSSTQMRTFIERVKQLLNDHEGIDQAFHMVRFTEMDSSSLNVLVYCFSNTAVWEDYLIIQEDVMLQIMDLVADMGLEVAFPTRTVYFRDEHWGAMPPPA